MIEFIRHDPRRMELIMEARKKYKSMYPNQPIGEDAFVAQRLGGLKERANGKDISAGGVWRDAWKSISGLLDGYMISPLKQIVASTNDPQRMDESLKARLTINPVYASENEEDKKDASNIANWRELRALLKEYRNSEGNNWRLRHKTSNGTNRQSASNSKTSSVSDAKVTQQRQYKGFEDVCPRAEGGNCVLARDVEKFYKLCSGLDHEYCSEYDKLIPPAQFGNPLAILREED